MIPSLTSAQLVHNCRLIIKNPLNVLEMDENGTLCERVGWFGWIFTYTDTSVLELPPSTIRVKNIKVAIVATIEAIRIESLKVNPTTFFFMETADASMHSYREVVKKIDEDPLFKFSTKVRGALTKLQTAYKRIFAAIPTPQQSSDLAEFILVNEDVI